MKKILFIIAILLPSLAFADQFKPEQFKANIKADGKDVPAEFVTISDNACALGSGFNACISQYTKGKVIIPKEVQYNSKTYQVQKINALAFRLCALITTASIPEGVTSVGDFAFIGCTLLNEVNLPATLKSLGSGCFISLPNLTTVRCNATTPPTWEYNDVFYFHKDGIGSTESVTYELKRLYVPTDAKSAYASDKQTDDSKGWVTAEGWSNFAAVVDGTETTFHIHNYEDLKTFRDNTNANIVYKEVELLADIDCNNDTWTKNIGDDEGYPFRGVFNGNGHTISNLKVENKYAGLFARLLSGQVINLTLKDCTFDGKESAGAVCGRLTGSASDCVVNSVFSENNVVKSAKECGGIVGHVSHTAQINNCVVKGGKIEAGNSTQWLGGIVGYVVNTTHVSDCALLETTATTTSNSKVGPFIAGAESGDKAYVANCYTTWDLGTSLENKVAHANCVYKGAHYVYKNDKGITQSTFNFTSNPKENPKETMLALGVLKLDKWVYCPGEYPLPACFEDRLPEPRVNVMTLRPKDMPYGRVNGLTLADVSNIDFTDFDGGENENSFVNKDFVTALLWVDDNLGGSLDQGFLPISKMTITANEGVDYERVLEADKTGETVKLDIPIFETNVDGTVKFDDDGQPIIDGYETLEEDEYIPVVYPVLLPYETTMPYNCQVFKPAKVVSDADGVATIELQMVEDRVMKANTPYYVVVNTDFVELGTPYQTTLDPQVIKIGLDDYEFSGTSYFLDKGAAVENNIYQVADDDDLKWNVMTADKKQDVPAFRAFFRSVTGKKSAIQLTFETISDKDFEYEAYYNSDDSRYLYVTKYKGDGGDVVVPNTVTANVGGFEQTMPVAFVNNDIFKDKADKIRSIDLTQCEYLEEMYVGRDVKGNSFYGLKENTLVFMPEDKAFPGVNVVVGGKCQKLLLKEGETFYSPRAFKTYNVEYKRNMAANDFYTICLPYSAPAKDGVKYYALSGVSGATLQFDEVTETEPGVPYLVVTSSAIEDLDFDGDDKTTTNVVKTTVDGSAVNGYTMHGTFTKLSPAETVGKYILQAGNKWQKAKTENATVYIDSFRAYLTGSANARELLESELGDGTTAIKNIHTTDKDGTEQWYDLNGRRIDNNSSKKGVYIQKGKKVVFK